MAARPGSGVSGPWKPWARMPLGGTRAGMSPQRHARHPVGVGRPVGDWEVEVVASSRECWGVDGVDREVWGGGRRVLGVSTQGTAGSP